MINLNWRSKDITDVVIHEHNHSLFYSMEYLPKDFERTLVGIVSDQNEIIPGHFHLNEISLVHQRNEQL